MSFRRSSNLQTRFIRLNISSKIKQKQRKLLEIITEPRILEFYQTQIDNQAVSEPQTELAELAELVRQAQSIKIMLYVMPKQAKLLKIAQNHVKTLKVCKQELANANMALNVELLKTNQQKLTDMILNVKTLTIEQPK